MLATLGATKVATVPLDPDELSAPERALLGEWVNDWHRRQKEAADRAEAERKKKAGAGKA